MIEFESLHEALWSVATDIDMPIDVREKAMKASHDIRYLTIKCEAKEKNIDMKDKWLSDREDSFYKNKHRGYLTSSKKYKKQIALLLSQQTA